MIRLLACRKDSCTTFTSSPFAFNLPDKSHSQPSTYLRNIEKGKSQKKSWYQYIFFMRACQTKSGPQPRETPLADQTARASWVRRRRLPVLQRVLQGSSLANCPPLCGVEGISFCLGLGVVGWPGLSFLALDSRSALRRKGQLSL